MVLVNGILLLCAIRLVKAVTEIVWLEDINNDHDKRNLDMGLPETLEFNLKRDAGGTTKLQLQENKFVSPNAPIYKVVIQEGIQKVVKIDSNAIIGTKYYVDKKTGAAVQVSCTNQPLGPCFRTIEGMLHIEGFGYSIRPASSPHSVRSFGSNSEVPHEIKRFVPPTPEAMPMPNNIVLGQFGNSYVRQPNASMEDKEDNVEFQDTDTQTRFTTKTQWKRQTTKEYTIEITALIDRFYWKKYFDISTAKNGMTQDEATMYHIRRRISMVINGVSLVYDSIDDPEITVHISLAAIVLYKAVDSGDTIPTWDSITILSGKEFIDGALYLNQLTDWIKESGLGLPGNDHLMLMTSLNLYSGSATFGHGVLGIAWINALCTKYRSSVNEDLDDFFTLTTLAAHELGHNIGAFHDGHVTSADCSDKDLFIMAPYAIKFRASTPYTRNPWRFSQCAINRFKTKMAAQLHTVKTLKKFKKYSCLSLNCRHRNRRQIK